MVSDLIAFGRLCKLRQYYRCYLMVEVRGANMVTLDGLQQKYGGVITQQLWRLQKVSGLLRVAKDLRPHTPTIARVLRAYGRTRGPVRWGVAENLWGRIVPLRDWVVPESPLAATFQKSI